MADIQVITLDEEDDEEKLQENVPQEDDSSVDDVVEIAEVAVEDGEQSDQNHMEALKGLKIFLDAFLVAAAKQPSLPIPPELAAVLSAR